MLNKIIDKFHSRMNILLRKQQLDAQNPTTIQSEEISTNYLQNPKQAAARKALEELRKTSKVGNVLSPLEDEWEAIN